MADFKPYPKNVEALKPALLKRAQIVFNAFIRERDKEKNCITCDGRVEQACHLFTVNHSAIRFDESNAHGGCMKCNYYLHPEDQAGLEAAVLSRIGEKEMNRLCELAHQPKQWTRDELREIINHYKLKIRETIHTR